MAPANHKPEQISVHIAWPPILHSIALNQRKEIKTVISGIIPWITNLATN